MSSLKNARNKKNLTQSQLSEKLQAMGRKVSAQQISSWERGDYFPSHKNLSAICEILSLDLNYFTERSELGESYFAAHSEINLPSGFSLVEQRKGAISPKSGLRPYNDADFSFVFRDEWVEQFGGAKNLFVIKVEGDSMSPTLMEGDIVLINKNIDFAGTGGGIFAINWCDMTTIKRLQLNPKTDEIIIKYDNKEYDSIAVKPHEIQIEGEVIWYGRELKKLN